MRSLALAPLLLTAATAMAAETPTWKWTPEAIVDTVGVSAATLSPDGGQIVFLRSRWRSESAKPGPAWANLWRVPFAGGEAQRLTTADADDHGPAWSPDGSRIAFLSRRGGDPPRGQIFLLPASGGEPEVVSPEKADVAAFRWSPDGKTIAYLAVDPKSEEREKAEKAGQDGVVVDQDLRPRRLFILDPATRKAQPLAALGDLSAWDFDWAPDGQALVASVTDRNRTDDSYMLKRVLVLPLAGERRELAGVVGKVGELAWSKDGKTIAYLGGVDASDPSAGSLFVVPAAGGEPRNLTGAQERTLLSFSWLKDGRLAVASVTGTRTLLELLDPATRAIEPVVAPGLAAFGGASWSADGKRYAFVGATATHPPDVFAGTRPAKGETAVPPRRLVDSNPQLAGLPLSAQETIRYRTQDGAEIEAVLIRPLGFREATRYPLVAIIHGGPEAQYLDAWNNNYAAPGQALAERGYLVLFPNYRGSTGRGVAFAKADHNDLGGKELTDVLDGIDHLIQQGLVDPKRVGITGGSYGGYFTALAVTRHSDRFAAGVELFGIVNWESFLGQTDIPEENSLVHWNLWCYEHPQLCRERSAVGNLATAATPTLILQGREDQRVPKPQSDELYAALRFKNVPVEYVVYPREGHGFRERWHRTDALTRLLGWFERYLGPR